MNYSRGDMWRWIAGGGTIGLEAELLAWSTRQEREKIMLEVGNQAGPLKISRDFFEKKISAKFSVTEKKVTT
jgi:hypothetical protein